MKFSPKCHTDSNIGKFVIKFGNFILYLGKNRGRLPTPNCLRKIPEMPHNAVPDLGLHCLPMTLLKISRKEWVNICQSMVCENMLGPTCLAEELAASQLGRNKD